jgi:DNA replication protein DnaC
MSEPTYERMQEQLRRLGLLQIQATVAATLARAEAEGWGYVALLDHLLEEEIAAREARRIKNALKLAGLPFLKTLDAFDFAFQPSVERGRVLDLAALGFVERHENVLLLGPPGVGKTHLAVALAVRACQYGRSVYFTSLDGMIRGLGAAERAGKLAQKLKSYTTKSQVLVIDEVGYLPLSRQEANYLFQVVTGRYERSSLILTSNKAVTEWPEVLGDQAMATAILDRILHHAHIFSIKGNSYRLRERALSGLLPPADRSRETEMPAGERV